MLLCINYLWEARADACFNKGKSCQFCPPDIHETGNFIFLFCFYFLKVLGFLALVGMRAEEARFRMIYGSRSG